MPDIFTSKEEKIAPKPQPTFPTTTALNVGKDSIDSSAILGSKIPQGTQVGLLSSFCINPLGIKFVNQEKGENIVLFLRRHFITNVPWIIFTVIISLIPPLIFAIFTFTHFSLFVIPQQLMLVLLIFYYLVVFNYALMHFIIWFYHVGIVTQKRLLDLDVFNILSHHLAETEIADIVDVSFTQNGFFQSFFNYGDVPIQTEAIKANFEFEEAPKPATVSDIITDLRPIRPSEARIRTKGENANA